MNHNDLYLSSEQCTGVSPLSIEGERRARTTHHTKRGNVDGPTNFRLSESNKVMPKTIVERASTQSRLVWFKNLSPCATHGTTGKSCTNSYQTSNDMSGNC